MKELYQQRYLKIKDILLSTTCRVAEDPYNNFNPRYFSDKVARTLNPENIVAIHYLKTRGVSIMDIQEQKYYLIPLGKLIEKVEYFKENSFNIPNLLYYYSQLMEMSIEDIEEIKNNQTFDISDLVIFLENKEKKVGELISKDEMTFLFNKLHILRRSLLPKEDLDIYIRRVENLIIERNKGLIGKKIPIILSGRNIRYISYDNREELFQQGMLGIKRAIKRYDPKKGAFSTYGNHYIAVFIRRAIDKIFFSIKKKDYEKMKKEGYKIIPLDGEDSKGRDISEMLGIEDERIVHSIDRIALIEAMSVLDPREEQIIHLYYYENQTYQMIGDKLGITRERVRQILNEAYGKLKTKLT